MGEKSSLGKKKVFIYIKLTQNVNNVQIQCFFVKTILTEKETGKYIIPSQEIQLCQQKSAVTNPLLLGYKGVFDVSIYVIMSVYLSKLEEDYCYIL